MKKKLIFFCCLSMATVAVYFVLKSSSLEEKEPIYIAVVGPMQESGGKAMQEGVAFYEEQINNQGGIDGRKVECIFLDDQNDPKVAQRIARTLAVDNKVLAVLGHYDSSTSSVAGKIYKKNGIPALTASATVESVIQDNEWYFRTIPGNALEAKFAASYMYDIISFYRNISQKEIVEETIPASIIFSQDNYGISLLKNFEKIAKQFDIAIKGKWAWDDKKSSSDQIESITKELAEIDDPGVIYFATHAAEGVQIITGLKDAGKTYPMIASAALARDFFHELKTYSKERETLGYYSDGIYFVSPYITALSGVEGVEFQIFFFEKHKKESGVVSSCYYDAAQIIVQAIKTSGIQGKKHIREDRRNIRKALTEMYNEDKAIKGVTGKLWFDKNGSVRKEYALGIWQKQKELPAFFQYKTTKLRGNNVLQKALDGEVFFIDDLAMHSTRIVYVGVEHFKLISINKKKFEYTAEFELRFRYPTSFDTPTEGSITSSSPMNYQFTNAISKQLIKGHKEQIKNKIKTHIIHMQAAFSFDPNRLLFGYCPLFIGIRNERLTYQDLIYVAEKKTLQAEQLPSGWSIESIMTFSDILSKKTTLGIPAYLDSNHTLNYSRFNIMTMINM
ncbi:MAG: amino acid ABC transporter substrate-binding protein [Candidatus Electrothrix sp. AU1_5]|nr:amino acid ABC transporter substrate-binding protein [Candidatus Electrothrix gigas]